MTRQCTNCAKPLQEEWLFCDTCGARVGADPVTTINALAAYAGLPADTVLRVILREPASTEAKEKVGAAVAALGLPDYPRPDGSVDVVPAAATSVVAPADASLADQLREVFAELVDGLARERRERMDDVALTTQLVREGWTNVDRRLGRLEKMVERIERHAVPDDPHRRRSHISSNGAD